MFSELIKLSDFLTFLEEINMNAAQYIKEMEAIIFQDPSSAVVKARKFAEVILKEVFEKENIHDPNISTFYERVAFLTKGEYIKSEIQKSFDTIRISGNKAAHPGEFNDLAEAYKLHRELYKIAIWYYEVYTSEHLKVPLYETPQPPKQENIEELIQKKLKELLGKDALNQSNEKQKPLNNTEDFKNESLQLILPKDLNEDESYLLREVRRLKDSAQEAIENANQFSLFKDYLHIDRKVQLDLEGVLSGKIEKDQGNLILLCGNVGDGKSHLLAYLKKKKRWLIDKYTIFNDATESFSPNKDAMETLEEILNDFSDQNIESSKNKVILAINMGVLHNFISIEHKEYTYNRLKQFISDSN